MTEPVLTVSWSNHANDLALLCKTMFENNYFVDCTIAAEGKSLKAHRLILSACSPYFHMLFSEESDKHPIVILKDTLFDTLKMMMDFVYCGKAEIPANQYKAFVELAVSLHISGLNNSLRKERRTAVDGNAEGNVGQCTSMVQRSICEVASTSEGSFSNSSQQFPFQLSHGYADTQRESTVPFMESNNSQETAQPDVVIMPLTDHEILTGYKVSEMSTNTESGVKCAPVDSEIEILETKIEVSDDERRDESTSANVVAKMTEGPNPLFKLNLDQYSYTQRESSVPFIESSNSEEIQSRAVMTTLRDDQSPTVFNDTEMSVNTETNMKYSPSDTDMEFLDFKDELSDDGKKEESTSSNFVSKITDEPNPSLRQNSDRYSRAKAHSIALRWPATRGGGARCSEALSPRGQCAAGAGSGGRLAAAARAPERLSVFAARARRL